MRDPPQPDEPSTGLPPGLSSPPGEQGDRLTIGRLLLLTAGVALGLVLFGPPFEEGSVKVAEVWRLVANAVLVGLAIPAPLFCIGRVIGRRPLGAGGLYVLAVGLGVLLLLPAAVLEWRARIDQSITDTHGMTGGCLSWVLPLMGLWYLLAALISGDAGRRLFSPTTPWIERYGFLLALLWFPLGVWLLVDIYRDVLH